MPQREFMPKPWQIEQLGYDVITYYLEQQAKGLI